MVRLSLSSTKGNAGVKIFPTVGYLGLTPVRVDGVVRTKIEADGKLLPATSLSIHIRCYEQRTRIASTQTSLLVDVTQMLWQKPDDVEYESIGASEFAFKLRIPPNVNGFSNAAFVDYRCIWRLEAVLNHIPISGVGSRQIRHSDLNLVRYDVPPWIPTSLKPDPFLGQTIDKPRIPRIRYSVHPPRTAIGPMDLVSIPIHLQAVDRDISVRGASVTIERRICLNDNPATSSSSSPLAASTSQPSPILLDDPTSSSRVGKGSHGQTLGDSPSAETLQLDYDDIDSVSLNSSNPTITPGTVYSAAPSELFISESSPLLPNTSQFANAKTVVHAIASAESSGSFARDSAGVFSKTLTLQWPVSRSPYRWAIGETVSSDLVSVRFFIRTKISVASPWGTETIELADAEVFVVSTNDTERQLAISKYMELQETASLSSSRSKSKSPRRKRSDRGDDDPVPPSPAPYTALANIGNTPGLSDNGSKSLSARKVKSRRPHTSAGPRDKPLNFAGGAYGQTRGREGEESAEMSSNSISHDTSAGIAPPAAKRRSELIMRDAIPSHPGPRESHTFRPTSSTTSTSSSSARKGKNAITSSFVGGPSGASGSHGSKLSSSSFWSTVHSNPRLTSPKMRDAPSGSSTSTSNSLSSMRSASSYTSADPPSASEGGGAEKGDHIREWEEELARIENRSRKSSDLLGFFRKRKKSTSDLKNMA